MFKCRKNFKCENQWVQNIFSTFFSPPGPSTPHPLFRSPAERNQSAKGSPTNRSRASHFGHFVAGKKLSPQMARKKQKGRKLFIGWKWQLDLKVSTNSGMMGSRFFVSYVYLRLGVFMLLHNGRVATSAIQGTGTPRQAWHGKSRTWSLTKGHLCGVYKLSCWWSNKPPIWIDALYMANLWQMIPPIWIDTNHMDWSFTNW